MIGTILDQRYRVLKRLGEGGMGEVYLVEHVQLRRREALKVLRAELAREPAFVSRFRREARATNRLQHPNIIGVHDFGQLPDGRFYLTSEYAEGQSLAVELRHAPFTLPRALWILHQLADAVDHAHERGVIHRDLKPENVILVEQRERADVAKVLDFGIAKIVAPDHSETAGITTQGDVFGTVEYMSPEQISGDATDPRMDLYALGCVAYELVVGEPPFVGRSMQVMHRHVTESHVPPSARVAMPAAFDELIARCLEKQPARRFQTGRELRQAIERVPGFTEPRASSGRRRAVATASAQDGDDATVHDGAAPTLDKSAPTFAELIHALAGRLVDLGARDPQLAVELAAGTELDEELQLIDERQHKLRSDERQLEGGAHAVTLRFQPGELSFAKTQALEREQSALTDRAIELAARRAEVEERMHAWAIKLEPLCRRLAVSYDDMLVHELCSALERGR